MSSRTPTDACALRERLAAGAATAADLVDETLNAIRDRDGDTRAYLDVYGDAARDRAARLDRSGGARVLPLGGIPVALKDNICVAGRRTTCGSRMLETYRSPYDATVVERLEAAGAVVIGKTNMDEFGMGSSTENSAFGPTRNPRDRARVPGGSSGGSAAAVADGTAVVALGSDTGGSIRQPAAFCGVVGYKPSYGGVSRYGLVAFASSFDQIGPLARSVRDAALVTSVIGGHDRRDATSVRAFAGRLDAERPGSLRAVRLGVPRRFLDRHVDDAVRAAFDDTVARASAAGAIVADVDLGHADDAVAAYYVIANAEASANLTRFDGVGFGHRSAAATPDAMAERTRGDAFGEEVKRRILLGTYVLSAGYHDEYYERAQRVRAVVVRELEAALDGCDALLLPTAPTPAFRMGEKVQDPLQMYLCDVFTIPANLAGLPAISLPVGSRGTELPVGVQLVGRAFGDAALLEVAACVEALYDEGAP